MKRRLRAKKKKKTLSLSLPPFSFFFFTFQGPFQGVESGLDKVGEVVLLLEDGDLRGERERERQRERGAK